MREITIGFACIYKFGVGSACFDAAVFENYDAVGHHRGCHAVRHDQAGDCAIFGGKIGPEFLFVRSIESSSSGRPTSARAIDKRWR